MTTQARQASARGRRQPDLSVSEARAEVATILLWALLDELPAPTASRVKRAAAEEVLASGVAPIIREGDWLLPALED